MQKIKLALIIGSVFALTACGGNKEGVAACEKVFSDLTAAIDKAGDPNASKMMKEQLETAKKSWASVSDQKQLAEQCNTMGTQMKAAIDAMPKK